MLYNNLFIFFCLQRQWLEVKAEEERWKGVPEWKKKIILEKQKKKSDEEVSLLQPTGILFFCLSFPLLRKSISSFSIFDFLFRNQPIKGLLTSSTGNFGSSETPCLIPL